MKQQISLYSLKTKIIGFRENISDDTFFNKLETTFQHKSLFKGYILYGPLQFVNNLCGTNLTYHCITVHQIEDIRLPTQGCELSLKLNDDQFEESMDQMFHERKIIYKKDEEIFVSYCENVNDTICKKWFDCICCVCSLLYIYDKACRCIDCVAES